MLIIGCDFHTRYQQIAMGQPTPLSGDEPGTVPQTKAVQQKRSQGELIGLALGPWASRGREELLKLLDQLNPAITELDRAVLEEAQRREDAVLLMTHPGIGPVTSLAFVLAIGPITRFHRSKKIASYLGLNPSEESSGGRREPSANKATPWCAGC